MEPEDAFDAIHMAAAEQVAAFLVALEGAGRMPKEEARRHGDNAYLFVEFLANTYPKMPRDANERDVWVFLFDYAITQTPFAGPTTRLVPRSVGLFIEFLALQGRLRELDYLREAFAREDLFTGRLERFEAIARKALEKDHDRESLAGEMEDWWAELEVVMRPRGLAPDASLAGGENGWNAEMGPVEAAIFDAVCLLLMKRTRELNRQVRKGEDIEDELLRVQSEFMLAPNRGLGKTPLQAIAFERAQLGTEREGGP